MRYTVIATDGTLATRDCDLDLTSEIGPEGPNRVRLDPHYAAAGWVNDMGLRRPETYPRNVTGSCVLTVLGAAVQPYAGPVVITGWQWGATPTEICDLPTPGLIADVHQAVSKALGEEPDPDGAINATKWAERIRELADHVKACESPTLRFVPGGDLL
ncbi:hypothetical protein NOGI109294_10070 [Nocardiopsis gilva]|uniref:hypothetical protein n=1 Tax=Nocardiopsis gilva TaxID=280236 RepID=UPI00034D1B66|nr:hypothetical protein [Nocardiopsis gilva]